MLYILLSHLRYQIDWSQTAKHEAKKQKQNINRHLEKKKNVLIKSNKKFKRFIESIRSTKRSDNLVAWHFTTSSTNLFITNEPKHWGNLFSQIYNKIKYSKIMPSKRPLAVLIYTQPPTKWSFLAIYSHNHMICFIQMKVCRLTTLSQNQFTLMNIFECKFKSKRVLPLLCRHKQNRRKLQTDKQNIYCFLFSFIHLMFLFLSIISLLCTVIYNFHTRNYQSINS